MSLTLIAAVAAVLAVFLLLALIVSVRGLKSGGDKFSSLQSGQERIERSVREEIAKVRQEAERIAKLGREEHAGSIKRFGDSLGQSLGQSMNRVNDQIEKVQEGLGKMQSLAANVDDLKRVMVNVGKRGAWGEVQLAAIIEETFTQDQYEKNVVTKPGSGKRVEFAIKLPGGDDEPVWLPIDAKFPTADYESLVKAQEAADVVEIREAGKALETRIKQEAKKINEKYIHPPNTIDFAIMFLPTEGLFAEVIRRPGLFDILRRDNKVVVAGPTTLTVLLNSLRMGFQTLAIEKSSSEVLKTLGEVKAELGAFENSLKKAKDNINQAGKSVDEVGVRQRALARRLRDVEQLPSADDNGQ